MSTASWPTRRLSLNAQDESPVLARLHCADRTFVEVTQAYLLELAATFPEVDAPAELAKAARWVQDNPDKRRPAYQAHRFLLTWFGYAREEWRGQRQATHA